MKRFVEGEDRSQSTLFPERLDDYIAEDNPVRVIDAFVDALPEVAAIQVFYRDMRVIVGDTEIVDADHVRMVDVGDQFVFLQEKRPTMALWQA